MSGLATDPGSSGPRLRIGFDATALHGAPHGIGRYASELLGALAADRPGHDYVLLSHRRLDPTRLDGAMSACHPARVPTLPWRVPWVHALAPVAAVCESFDVCHFLTYQAPLATGRPTIVTIHDCTLLTHPELHPRRRVVLGRSLLRWAARRAHAIITPTHAVRAELLHLLGTPPERVHAVPEAAATVFQAPADPAIVARVVRRFGLRPGFILAVGTIEPRKNLERLADAVAALRRDGFDNVLVHCGPTGWRAGPILERLGRADVNGAVLRLGTVSDAELRALHALAGAFAMPSLAEGFGLPLVEALACGTPTVTSGTGALAEVAGDAALTVDPTDALAIRDELERALTDEGTRARLQEAGTRRARTFSWMATARATAAIYEAAAGRTLGRASERATGRAT